LLAVLCALLPVRARTAGPVEIGSAAQLFVERSLVHSAEGVGFTLHPAEKHPANPLLKADQPWEGWRLGLYGNVLYDEGERLFKMWYVSDQTPEFPHFATLYATSPDGIQWTKPLVGTVPSATGSRRHNAVADACLLPSVLRDAAEADPQQRYKMICWIQQLKPAGGPHTMVSPDGLHWTRQSQEPICRSSDVITGYRDEARGLYVAFPKHSTAVRGPVRRCFTITTSKDFKTWTAPRYIFVPDEEDDAGSKARLDEVRPLLDVPDDPKLMRTEFYGLGAYVAESCTVAFPWVFTVNNNARYGNHEGPGEIQLAASRDLQKWERPFRTPVVPRGKLGEWDCGFFTTVSRAIRVGDEVWLYYCGANYLHGTPALYRAEGTGRGTRFTSAIGLARWKLDRFVSADAGDASGVLTTVPVVFRGGKLELNASTGPAGKIEVELLNEQGAVLAKSLPVTGDDLRHQVQWTAGVKPGALAGQPVTVRFRLQQAQLFSFAFRQ
jgi:hypothetical protein